MAKAKAYILIETTTGQVKNVVAGVRGLPGLISADAVTGPYDIIVVFEAEDLSAVGDLVTEHVHTIGGIVRTVTCLAVT